MGGGKDSPVLHYKPNMWSMASDILLGSSWESSMWRILWNVGSPTMLPVINCSFFVPLEQSLKAKQDLKIIPIMTNVPVTIRVKPRSWSPTFILFPLLVFMIFFIRTSVTFYDSRLKGTIIAKPLPWYFTFIFLLKKGPNWLCVE